MPQDGHLGSDVLSLEATLWRLDAVRGEEATAARGREREAAQGGRRSHARQRDVAGGDPPQTMTPARGREMIDFVRHSVGTTRPRVRKRDGLSHVALDAGCFTVAFDADHPVGCKLIIAADLTATEDPVGITGNGGEGNTC